MVFVFPSHCYVWWGPAFLEMSAHLPAHGMWLMNSLFALLVYMALALPIKLSYLNPRVFPLLPSQFSSHPAVSEQLCRTEVPAGVKPHNCPKWISGKRRGMEDAQGETERWKELRQEGESFAWRVGLRVSEDPQSQAVHFCPCAFAPWRDKGFG